MFSQRRKRYKNMVFASVLVAVAILALVVLLGYLGSLKDNPNTETPVNEVISATEDTEEPAKDDDRDTADDDVEMENRQTEGEPSQLQMNEKKQTYYLLKYDNDVIRIYFSDQQGKLTELEETAIVYETLSTEDQTQFQEGIQVENRDELNRLLMDYES